MVAAATVVVNYDRRDQIELPEYYRSHVANTEQAVQFAVVELASSVAADFVKGLDNQKQLVVRGKFSYSFSIVFVLLILICIGKKS